MRWILSSDSDFGVSVFEISMCQDSGKAWSAMPCVCLMFGERYQSFPRVDPENKFFYIRTRGSTTLMPDRYCKAALVFIAERSHNYRTTVIPDVPYIPYGVSYSLRERVGNVECDKHGLDARQCCGAGKFG